MCLDDLDLFSEEAPCGSILVKSALDYESLSSRVEGSMSRVEGTMSRAIFFLKKCVVVVVV